MPLNYDGYNIFAFLRSDLFGWSLQWRHNERDGVSNHQPNDCLLTRLFRRDQRKHNSSASLAFVWGIRSAVTGDFPTQRPVTRKRFPFDYVIM